MTPCAQCELARTTLQRLIRTTFRTPFTNSDMKTVSDMPSFSKSDLISAISSDGYGYYPYSSEDTFELFRSETTRYSVFRVPVEFVKSFSVFAAQSFIDAYGAPKPPDLAFIEISPADQHVIAQHWKWLDSTDAPEALKFKELALRGCDGIQEAVKIEGRDCCVELIVARSKDFYIRFLWFTTG